jgi:hypothetical protein
LDIKLRFCDEQSSVSVQENRNKLPHLVRNTLSELRNASHTRFFAFLIKNDAISY